MAWTNYKLVSVAPACKPMGMAATTTSIEAAAARVASLLAAAGTGLCDPGMSTLEFEPRVSLRPLDRGETPADVWAVDGGQALIADARCIRVVGTRASRTRFRAGTCVLEEEGELRVHVLAGVDDTAAAVATLGVDGMAPDTTVDVNLLRDRWEWDALEGCVEDADHGAFVLMDGDLLPDWRIPPSLPARILGRAAERGVVVAGITKHSSLSRGGAPLVGLLEVEAASALGPRAMWWAPIARTKTTPVTDPAGALQVVAARLDPDARYAFRVDLPADADPVKVLARLSALCDDAAFPGYPYPLAVADRIAACPGWVRQEAALQLDELLGQAGIGPEVRERAFADRHRLMERA